LRPAKTLAIREITPGFESIPSGTLDGSDWVLIVNNRVPTIAHCQQMRNIEKTSFPTH